MDDQPNINATAGSQFQEDAAVLRYFGEDHPGFFVEVGANDGVHGSNTHLLEQRGWKGILVEPSPTLAQACRAARPASVVVNKAIVGDSEIASVEFYEYSRGTTGARFDGMSCVGKRSPYEEAALAAGSQVTRSTVPAVRLDDALKENNVVGPIDFLSIDVEGLELEVLRGLSLEVYRPRLILVEDNSFGGDSRVTDHLRRHGYVPVRRTFVNLWYLPADASADGIRVRHGLPMHLAFKLLAAEAKLLDNPRFYPEMRRMIDDERGRLPGCKYAVVRLTPIWLLKIARRLAQWRRR